MKVWQVTVGLVFVLAVFVAVLSIETSRKDGCMRKECPGGTAPVYIPHGAACLCGAVAK